LSKQGIITWQNDMPPPITV